MELNGAEIRNFFEIVIGEKSVDSKSRNIVSIPHYQRPYRWTTDLVANLIQDWAQADSDYFAGSIVTVVRDDSKIFELIDGQQRLTTIYLANFIRFLLYRVMVRECCVQRRLIRSHDDILQKLIETQSYFLRENDSLQRYLEKTKQTETEIKDEDFEKYYRESAFLPIDCWENDQSYLEKHSQQLKKYLEKSTLLLSYHRSFFNQVLLEVLSSACIKISDRQKPELSFMELEPSVFQGGGKTYIEAIQTLFDNFCKIVEEESAVADGYNYARVLTEKISDFLQQIQICVIETNNPDDAYTLFETLNERSLALDNLDLIKNQFFKCFVETNKNLSESEKDKSIEELDNFWNDEIFKGAGTQEKGLITFLAVAYITGNTKITPKQTDKSIRSALKKYLSEYSESNPYTINSAKTDFNVFNACRIILDNAGVKYKSIHDTAYEAFYDSGTTLKKCMHFLRGAGQDTVLAGLIAAVLNYIRIKEKASNFEGSKVQALSSNYLDGSLPKELQTIAFDLWKISMKSKSYNKVLDHSWELLNKNKLCSNSFQSHYLSAAIDNVLDNEFKDWLQKWSYGGKNYKIRILFARCFQLTEEDGKLKKASHSTSPLDKQDVDHMEPVKIDMNHPKSYFEHVDRSSIINQLGNMMILPSSDNKKKSNSPMQNVFTAFASTNLSSHFIVEKTKELLDANHTPGNDGIKVPNEAFFTERKKFLIDTFMKAVEIPFE
jgi:hypothetical protein